MMVYNVTFPGREKSTRFNETIKFYDSPCQILNSHFFNYVVSRRINEYKDTAN